MSSFRYGFKKESEDYAEEFREELRILPHEPLCPRKLAQLLDIPIFGVSTNSAIDPDVVSHWQNGGSGGEFSGLIIESGTYKEIHHNDFHHPRRQNSNIAHELAHIILGHNLKSPIQENGERLYEKSIEDEAKWLGATLLLPKKATVFIVKNGLRQTDVESIYGVSNSLFQYRVQVTDTMGMVRNSRKKYIRKAGK